MPGKTLKMYQLFMLGGRICLVGCMPEILALGRSGAQGQPKKQILVQSHPDLQETLFQYVSPLPKREILKNTINKKFYFYKFLNIISNCSVLIVNVNFYLLLDHE